MYLLRVVVDEDEHAPVIVTATGPARRGRQHGPLPAEALRQVELGLKAAVDLD